MTYGSVVHDPTGTCDDDLPPDREPHESLARTVMRWTPGNTAAVGQADIDQISLQLGGYLALLVREVQAALSHLPQDPETLARAGAD